jgi:uncharacterized membrane protein YhaH (DUF805 family)
MPAAAAPLDQPYYGASFAVAIARFFKKYATFSGRASRSEFWWSFLFLAVVETVLSIPVLGWTIRFTEAVMRYALDTSRAINPSDVLPERYFQGLMPTGLELASLLAVSVFSLAALIPSIAVSWRRLHDAGFSGLFWLFNLANLGIVPLIMCILPSKPDGARFDAPGSGTGVPTGAGYAAPSYNSPGPDQPYAPPGYGQPYAPDYGQPPAYQGEPPAYGSASAGPTAPTGAGPEPLATAPAIPPEPEIGPDGLPRYPG